MPQTSHPFERSHSILVGAPAARVFDYVTNPKSWPEWIPASHHLECENRPMRFGDVFHEHWSTRTGKVELDWLVIVCEAPRVWIGLTNAPFIGPIVVQYDCAAADGGVRFTRTLRNPARPKAPSAEVIQRIDDEAALALSNIKRNVEAMNAD
jgi:hypothetical protein